MDTASCLSPQTVTSRTSDLFVHPQVLTLLPTYRCTSRCRSCCFGSHPEMEKMLDMAIMENFIDEGSRFDSVRLVVFSGGECFLLGDNLIRLVERAARKGYVTRCVTNGYWAHSLEKGRHRLQQLRNAGLNEINIGTGDAHQEFVPEHTIINAAELSVDIGFKHTLITIEQESGSQEIARSLVSNPRIAALRQGNTFFDIIESPWMPMDHRQPSPEPMEKRLNRDNVHRFKGCDSILSTIALTPDRKIGYCCGLTREMIDELNTSWDPGTLRDRLAEGGKDFIKIWLFVEGPERILAWAGGIDARIDWQGRYVHRCHACLAIYHDPLVMAAIKNYYHTRVDDVLMRFSLILKQQHLIEAKTYG
ncbi:MAG: radical SAM protein [Magnetococcales bacterium]|nr:radical SAM protein [Magnetococcales bacterium]